MKKVFASLLLASSILCLPLSGAIVEPIEHPAFTEALNGLPQYGVLTRHNNGSVYLKVSEEYLDKLFAVLQEIYGTDGLVKGSASIGAHVSVIRTSIGEPFFENFPEIGDTVEFSIIGVGSVVPDLDPKWERVWLVDLEAPALKALRESYGLSPYVGNTDNGFHISFATKLRSED